MDNLRELKAKCIDILVDYLRNCGFYTDDDIDGAVDMLNAVANTTNINELEKLYVEINDKY